MIIAGWIWGGEAVSIPHPLSKKLPCPRPNTSPLLLPPQTHSNCYDFLAEGHMSIFVKEAQLPIQADWQEKRSINLILAQAPVNQEK